MKPLYIHFNKIFLTIAGICMLMSARASVTFVKVSAVEQNDDQAIVQWTVSNQSDISSYEIEKSTDGINYIKVGEMPPYAGNNAMLTYNWTDGDFNGASIYYRIAGIETSAGPVYSREIPVGYGNNNNSGIPDITVYPNPVSGQTVHLQTMNIPDGVYTVSLVNEAGQTMWIREMDHTEGNTVETIDIGSGMQAGTYFMTVTGHNGYRFILKILHY
jgi:hypothetical protein